MLTLAKKVKKVQGLKRRWLTGSMGPVLVILLLVGVLISVGFASSYYNSARPAGEGRRRRGLFQHLCDDQLPGVLPQRHGLRRRLR